MGMRTWTSSLVIAAAMIGAAACDGTPADPDAGQADTGTGTDSGPRPDAGGELVVPEDYVFESRSMAGASSVSYGGQIARQVLIQDLKRYIGNLTTRAASASWSTAADPYAELGYFFSLPAADRSGDPHGITTDPAAAQSTYGDLSGSAFLLEKVAGNDTSTDYQDWSTEFVGWSDTSIADACAAAAGGADCGVTSPTRLMRAMLSTLAVNAMLARDGTDRMSPVDSPMALPVHVTESGLDLQQLVEKLLLSAIAFHQAADDYMDDDVADKGLLSDNVDAGSNTYTALEHAWDEGFGYFGAARTYGDWTPAELSAGPVYRDADSNGAIDLFSEYNFGASNNAAKRDHGSAATARTNMMAQAWSAFRTGRAIITHAGGALSDEEHAALREQRDLAIGAWEAVLAATVVHYINDTLQVMGDFGTAAFDHARFLTLAKGWSEMKGFALAFQFNPRSPVSATQFARLHELLRDAPVLPGSTDPTPEQYRADLREARGILGTAFGFDAANLGDDGGEGGW